jgi:hypothetical protein
MAQEASSDHPKGLLGSFEPQFPKIYFRLSVMFPPNHGFSCSIITEPQAHVVMCSYCNKHQYHYRGYGKCFETSPAPYKQYHSAEQYRDTTSHMKVKI